MRNRDARRPATRSTRLPATVLLVQIAAIAAAVLWLTLSPPPGDAESPAAGVELAPGRIAEPSAAEPANPPAQPQQQEDGATPEAAGEPPAPAAPDSPGEPPSQPPAGAPAPEASPPAAAPPAPPPAPDAAPEPRAEASEPTPADAPAPPAAPETSSGSGAQGPATAAAPMPLMMPKLPPAPPSPPLPKAPDPALIEETPRGPLPVIGRDGREAWRVYARPFNHDDRRPRLAVVLYGLGNSAAATRTAIQALPGVITLAFTPYADDLPSWIADARAAGHEVLLMVPMEPDNYPDFDPGPQALLTSLSGDANTGRLEWMLGRGVGYVGVTDFMGSRFTSSGPHMRAFLENLRKRGLMFLESRPAARAVAREIAAVTRVPFAGNTLHIDSHASRPSIDAQLREAERLARKTGEVVIMGYLYPVTLERVARWSATLEQRGLVLAPVSALAKRVEP